MNRKSEDNHGHHQRNQQCRTLYGTSSADSIFGFNGNDTLKGGADGDDLLFGVPARIR
jgi:Ca2+-binding RTX toxin-like protein